MISIIIPSYNYKRYLSNRINSILNQSYRDYELILIDDASTDGSLELAQELLSKSTVSVRIIENKINSGSVFAQWQKGLELAHGEYIWFAEADDFCASTFLEEVMPVLENNPGVGLVYTNSEVINKNNRVVYEDFYRRVHSFIDSKKWNSSYIRSGVAEIADTLFIRNTIPNASAVVMRTDLLRVCGGIPQQFKLSGDWMTYINVLMKSDIAYINKPLNYNRLHDRRVTVQNDHTNIFFDEALKIAETVIERLQIEDKSLKLFLCNIFDYIERSGKPLSVTIEKKLNELFPKELILQAQRNRQPELFLKRLSRLTPVKVYRKVFKRKIFGNG